MRRKHHRGYQGRFTRLASRYRSLFLHLRPGERESEDMNDSAGRVSSIVSLVLRRSGIFFLLAFALLAQLAWGQRLGPLVLDNQQRSKASSAERAAAAVRTPSLQLSLPPPATAALPPLGPDDLQRLQPQEGRPPSSAFTVACHRVRSR